MKTKEIIKSQYYASLAMLRQAIEECPDSLWQSGGYKNQFWHVVFHVLFFTHFYLGRSEDAFIPWEGHRDEIVSLEPDELDAQAWTPYTKDELLDYHQYCADEVEGFVNALDLEAESGFYWLPFNKMELQFYNIRHLQHHTGELSERLGTKGEIEVDWVGSRKAKT